MTNNRWSKITLVGALAAPLMFYGGTAFAQTVEHEQKASSQAIPDKSVQDIAPRSEIVPGVRLSNYDQQILGVIDSVVTHNSKDYALVTVGKFTKEEPPGLIALPLSHIQIDGDQLKYNMAWDEYKNMPVYDGSAPVEPKMEVRGQ